MIIYWLIWLEVVIANLLFIRPRMESKILFGITMLFLFIFIGFRYQIGGDWSNYLEIYDYFNGIDLINSIFITDIGYGFLNYISQKMGFTDTIFINAICGLIVIISLTHFAFKLKYYWLVLLSYFPYHLVVVSMGYTRQSVAISLSLLFFYFLLQKNILKALFFLLFAYLFHSTSIILLLFVPIVFIDFLKKAKLYYYLYCIFAMIFLSGAAFYFSRSDSLYAQGELSSAGFFIRWVHHTIPLWLLLVYRNKLKKNVIEKNIIYFMSFIILFVLILGTLFSTLADRFNLYFIFFDLFLIVFVFDKMIVKHRFLLLFSLILFYTISFYLWMFFGEWANKAWIPYQNYISNYLLQEVF